MDLDALTKSMVSVMQGESRTYQFPIDAAWFEKLCVGSRIRLDIPHAGERVCTVYARLFPNTVVGVINGGPLPILSEHADMVWEPIEIL